MFEWMTEQLIREKVLLKDFTFTKLGRQWGKIPKTKRTYEIDIVALNEQTKEILFAKSFSKRIDEYECKRVYCFDLKDTEQLLENSE